MLTEEGRAERFELLAGIDTVRLVRLLWQNRFRVDRPYLRSVRRITTLSISAGAFGLVDRLFYGCKVERTVISHPPVFIIGHWRSGTTWFEKLLSLDPRHCCPTFFQCIFPEAFLSGERFLKHRTAEHIPAHRPFDNVPLGVDEPFEDEFALLKTALVSPMLSFVFPRAWARYDRHCELANLRPKELQRWKRSLLKFAKKLTFITGGDRRLVLKSPAHGYRLKTILEVFPQARFVLMVRDPYRVFASTHHLVCSLLEHNRLHADGAVDLREIVFDRYLRMFESLERDLPLVPEGRLAWLRYEELEEKPLEHLTRIYKELDLGDFEPAREAIERYLLHTKDYRKNAYDLTSTDKKGIYGRWYPAFEAYGYEP